ncbi:hypothetical protein Tco_1262414 [Tanacetum coccineum]
MLTRGHRWDENMLIDNYCNKVSPICLGIANSSEIINVEYLLYTHTSRSTDVVGVDVEISGNNFNDWFLQLKMVLRVKRKLFVIEQSISLASPTDSEYLRSGIRYMIHNEDEGKPVGHMSLDEEFIWNLNVWYVLPTRALSVWFNLGMASLQ